jgi:hypothetical protein
MPTHSDQEDPPDIQFTLEDDDWAKRTWDLGEDPARLYMLLAMKPEPFDEAVAHFMSLPSAKAMPYSVDDLLDYGGYDDEEIKRWHANYDNETLAKYSEGQPRDDHGRFSSGPGYGGVKGAEDEGALLWPVSGEGKKGSVDALVTMDGLPEDIATKCVNRMVESMDVTPAQAADHITKLFEQAFNDGFAEHDAQWYHEASSQAQDLAKATGLSELTAVGVIAAMSPGKEWGANLASATKVAEWVTGHKDYEVTDALVDKINAQLAAGKGELKTDYRVKAGQNLGEILSQSEHAAAIVIAHVNKFDVGYGYGNVVKAVHIANAGESAINATLNGAKVRSFFNNIAQPNNPNFITIDTHMIRAMANGLGTPAGEARLRKIEDVVSKITGSPAYRNAELGAYPVMADVIRTVTADVNIRFHTEYTPAQVQAIVWNQQIRNYPRAKMKEVLKQIAGEESA